MSVCVFVQFFDNHVWSCGKIVQRLILASGGLIGFLNSPVIKTQLEEFMGKI